MSQEEPSETVLVLNDLAPVLREYLAELLGFNPEFTLIVWGGEDEPMTDSGKFVSNVERAEHEKRLRRLLDAISKASVVHEGRTWIMRDRMQ